MNYKLTSLFFCFTICFFLFSSTEFLSQFSITSIYLIWIPGLLKILILYVSPERTFPQLALAAAARVSRRPALLRRRTPRAAEPPGKCSSEALLRRARAAHAAGLALLFVHRHVRGQWARVRVLVRARGPPLQLRAVGIPRVRSGRAKAGGGAVTWVPVPRVRGSEAFFAGSGAGFLWGGRLGLREPAGEGLGVVPGPPVGVSAWAGVSAAGLRWAPVAPGVGGRSFVRRGWCSLRRGLSCQAGLERRCLPTRVPARPRPRALGGRGRSVGTHGGSGSVRRVSVVCPGCRACVAPPPWLAPARPSSPPPLSGGFFRGSSTNENPQTTSTVAGGVGTALAQGLVSDLDPRLPLGTTAHSRFLGLRLFI